MLPLLLWFASLPPHHSFLLSSKDDSTLQVSAAAAAAAAAAKSLQLCPTLCDPIDGSPSGSPVPGILQARTLEWGAIAFSVVGLSRQEFLTEVFCASSGGLYSSSSTLCLLSQQFLQALINVC